MGLIDELAPGPVALDSAPFIYLIEEHPLFLDVVEPLFRAVDAGRIQAVSSTLTLLEVLVVPYRLGHAALAERYEALLTRGRGLRLVELEHGLLCGAARLRATLGIETPDALQLAAALASNCRTFVTNDRRLPEIPTLRRTARGQVGGLGCSGARRSGSTICAKRCGRLPARRAGRPWWRSKAAPLTRHVA